jgi:hypothetical protein
MKSSRLCMLMVAVCMLILPIAAQGQDRSENEGCRACHTTVDGEQIPRLHMQFTADTWLNSGHANSNHGFNENTFCSECHSPRQWKEIIEDVALEDWQGVSCGSCHLSHHLAGEVGTRVGNWIVGSEDPEAEDSWELRFRDYNAQCQYCHPGHSGEQGFTEAGAAMAAFLECVDCHMPKINIPVDPRAYGGEYEDGRPTVIHDFGFHFDDREALEKKVEAACMYCHGIFPGDPVKDTARAIKLIADGAVHGEAIDGGDGKKGYTLGRGHTDSNGNHGGHDH